MRRIISCVATLLPLLVLTACGTTNLSRAGSSVQIVTESQRDCCCESLGQVVAAKSTGWTTESDIKSVYNKLRNQTAGLGGNAMYLMERNTEGNTWTGGTSSGVADALRCDFDKIKAANETKK